LRGLGIRFFAEPFPALSLFASSTFLAHVVTFTPGQFYDLGTDRFGDGFQLTHAKVRLEELDVGTL
jgi:hypothetical protein